MGKITLFNEDFKSFRIGDFPFEPFLGAMGEYHYRPKQWYGGKWYDPTPLSGSGGFKTWMITEHDGRKSIEYSAMTIKDETWIVMLATGEQDWTDYEVSADIRNFRKGNQVGIVFRYQNSRCYYSLCFSNGLLRLIRRNHEERLDLACKEFNYNGDRFYNFKVITSGSKILCYIDEELQFEVEDNTYAAGKIAICTLGPSQFTNIKVEMDAKVYKKIADARKEYSAEVMNESKKYPQPRLWKVIDFKDFGAGRNIRFGHLTGTSDWHIVIAQNQRRVHRDAFSNINCLTAIDLEGNVLWQIGEPNNKECSHITADLPFQVCDIDGDGKDEVIMSRDFKIYILEGSTGKVKKWIDAPYITEDASYLNVGSAISVYPFDRLNVDSIRMCDFSGKGRPSDILIKNRYRKVWVYDENLNLKWTFDAGVNTGHYPYTKDVNGDGREEMFIGYDMLDADGKKLWTLPIPVDHTDEIVIGKIDPDKDDLIGIVSGWEGFMLVDLQGNIVVRNIIGHAQRISVGNYRPDLPGLEICITTYHKNQGIIMLYDCKGKLLWSKEPSTNGNIITPVNWAGDGQDLILLNGNIALGGMIDGHYRQVVSFPDDGHAELCAEALDLTGDCRDEIVLWDEYKMYIYTQDTAFEGDTIYCPEKNPHYNASNYRGEYSFPAFKPYKED